ncbi:hypothetical protein SLITO_v1c04650 [Spiroplasma litorale]|uniref:Uncharacterized protein n=1 Tax=Spiroplasma litorale TaxID=216942 RepID=A0A0K1W1R3_9MOLU|nr:hypothetical protein SLITO_v1c04650 [Spiroplasma litorale]
MKTNKLNRCISYLFKSTLVSSYTYIYIFLIPLIFEILFYFLLIKNRIDDNRIITIAPILLFSLNLCSLFVTHLIISWRETIFLKQIKNFQINNVTFLIALGVVYLVYSLISLLIVCITLLLIDIIEDINKIMNLFKTTISSPTFIFVLFFIVLNIIVIYFISLLISGFIKNIYLIQAVSFAYLIFIISFGDYLIDSNYTNNIIYQFISYFNVEKYFNWLFYITYVNAFNGGQNLYLITLNISNVIPFKNVYAPLFSMAVIAPIIGFFSFYKFNNSTKI